MWTFYLYKSYKLNIHFIFIVQKTCSSKTKHRNTYKKAKNSNCITWTQHGVSVSSKKHFASKRRKKVLKNKLPNQESYTLVANSQFGERDGPKFSSQEQGRRDYNVDHFSKDRFPLSNCNKDLTSDKLSSNSCIDQNDSKCVQPTHFTLRSHFALIDSTYQIQEKENSVQESVGSIDENFRQRLPNFMQLHAEKSSKCDPTRVLDATALEFIDTASSFQEMPINPTVSLADLNVQSEISSDEQESSRESESSQKDLSQSDDSRNKACTNISDTASASRLPFAPNIKVDYSSFDDLRSFLKSSIEKGTLANTTSENAPNRDSNTYDLQSPVRESESRERKSLSSNWQDVWKVSQNKHVLASTLSDYYQKLPNEARVGTHVSNQSTSKKARAKPRNLP